MARPGHVPITRLRFLGRTRSLLGICRVFREHPDRGLSASEIAELADLSFRDVHQRLADTPELFVRLPKRPDTNVRYRLVSALAGCGEIEVARVVDAATRAETRTAALVVATFVAVAVVSAWLSFTS